MKIKGRGIVNRLESGVHLVSIADIRYLKDQRGNIKMQNGLPSIEIIFENKEKKRIALTILSGDSSQWIIDSLCNCLDLITEDSKIDVSVLIKRKLYIIVVNEYIIHNGARRLDSTGNEIFYPKVLIKFFNEKGPAPVMEESDLILEKESI